MQTIYKHSIVKASGFITFFVAVILAIVIALAGYFTLRSFNVLASHPIVAPVSQSVFEEKYGLQVSLIAVTAAGGKIDFRLKVLDAAKAQNLFKDKKNFPVLLTENGSVMQIPEEEKPENLAFGDNSNLLLLFPNSNGSIHAGSAVTLRFGDASLEPIKVK